LRRFRNIGIPTSSRRLLAFSAANFGTDHPRIVRLNRAAAPKVSPEMSANIYGKAMTDSKRQAHSNVVEMILKSRKPLIPVPKPRSFVPPELNGTFSVGSPSVQLFERIGCGGWI
jgi:hypothetical protein